MARKCTCTHIDPNQALCCRAAAAGMLGRAFRLPTSRGERCFVCEGIVKHNGQRGFRAHFAKSDQCGLAHGGCQALQGGGGISGGTLLPPPQAPPALRFGP